MLSDIFTIIIIILDIIYSFEYFDSRVVCIKKTLWTTFDLFNPFDTFPRKLLLILVLLC